MHVGVLMTRNCFALIEVINRSSNAAPVMVLHFHSLSRESTTVALVTVVALTTLKPIQSATAKVADVQPLTAASVNCEAERVGLFPAPIIETVGTAPLARNTSTAIEPT